MYFHLLIPLPQNLDADILQVLPRATPSLRNSVIHRSPLGSSFIRGYADGGEEKVKGQVIGIDLGM